MWITDRNSIDRTGPECHFQFVRRIKQLAAKTEKSKATCDFLVLQRNPTTETWEGSDEVEQMSGSRKAEAKLLEQNRSRWPEDDR